MKRILLSIFVLFVAVIAKAETSGNWTDNGYRAESFTTIDTGKKTISISSAAELALLAYSVKDNTYTDYTVTLVADIDLSGHYWIPIGTSTYAFNGTFDGGNHTISNLCIYLDGNTTGNVAGLFGIIGSSSTVKDLHIGTSTGYIVFSSASASCDIGAIAGINKGSIIGCSNKTEVRGNVASANVGGIAGQNNGSIQNCYNLGEVYTSNSTNHLGGIAGENSAAITNCFVMATISNAMLRGKIVGNGPGSTTGCFYLKANIDDFSSDDLLTINNNSENSFSTSEKKHVLLLNRTLYADESWNTLCLPFNIPAGATGYSPIAGAEVKALSSSIYSAGILTLTFEDATSIKAGMPYLVRWKTAIGNLSNPIFLDVAVSETSPINNPTTYVDFKGCFSPVTLAANDTKKLYLGSNNTLYYPRTDMSINSCRAYFELKEGLEVSSTSGSGIKAFALDFGEGVNQTTAIYETSVDGETGMDSWYTLDGRLLKGKPARRGFYLNKGHKVFVQ